MLSVSPNPTQPKHDRQRSSSTDALSLVRQSIPARRMAYFSTSGTRPRRTAPCPSCSLMLSITFINFSAPGRGHGANRSDVTSPCWLSSISRVEHLVSGHGTSPGTGAEKFLGPLQMKAMRVLMPRGAQNLLRKSYLSHFASRPLNSGLMTSFDLQ